MRYLLWIIALTVGLAGGARAAEAPRVLASIAPIHSLTAALMAGVGTPDLLVPPTASEHEQALKPSQVAELQKARLVIWVGDPLEGFLIKPLKSLPKSATVLTLLRAPGVTTLAAREGGPWEAHDHDHDHAGKRPADPIAELDGHLWLDAGNAARVAAAIAAALDKIDPANQAVYQANLAALTSRLAALDTELKTSLKPAAGVPFVVFHDAYQYAERAYGLTAVGSITVDPERKPGPKRLQALRQRVIKLDAKCVFSEPQHEPKLVETVIEGSKAKRGTLDPLGAAIPPGPEAYFQLMRNLSNSLTRCLAPTS